MAGPNLERRLRAVADVSFNHLLQSPETEPLPGPEAASVEFSVERTPLNEFLDAKQVVTGVAVIEVPVLESKSDHECSPIADNGGSGDCRLGSDPGLHPLNTSV